MTHVLTQGVLQCSVGVTDRPVLRETLGYSACERLFAAGTVIGRDNAEVHERLRVVRSSSKTTPYA